MIIDAKDLILGRMATVAAKKALAGETIDIVNAEEAVVSGSKKWIIADTVRRRDMGIPLKGPYFDRNADRFVRRAIRGMLPYKQEKGRKAFDRIKCHIGVPEQFKDKKAETIASANLSKLPNMKFIKVKELCRLIGGKRGQ